MKDVHLREEHRQVVVESRILPLFLFIKSPTFLSNWSSASQEGADSLPKLVRVSSTCTPNGAICFISPLYLGSISDPELTKVSGFLTKVSAGVSIMADRGFTIKDLLAAVGADRIYHHFYGGKASCLLMK